jgi:hypothetical protein
MMTAYEIERIAGAVVSRLVADERFAKMVAKSAQLRPHRLIGASKVAALLGCSRTKVIRYRDELGGICSSTGRWMFYEDQVEERYEKLCAR